MCVRYRYDANTHCQLTMVELIVSSKQTIPLQKPPIYPHLNEQIFVKFAYHEMHIRKQVKESGAQ